METGIERIASAAMGAPIDALASHDEPGVEKDNISKESRDIYEEVKGVTNSEKSLFPKETCELSYSDDLSYEGCAPSDVQKIEAISSALGNMENLEPTNWEQLTPDQRLETLSQVEDYVSQVTLRPACEVSSDKMDGMYGFHQGNKIVLNENLLLDGSPEGMRQALETLLHEGRHAYQHWNTDVCQVEPSSELVDSWRLNWDMGYENGDSGLFDFENMGLKRYLTQPVEVDARVFAESVLNATEFNGGYYA